MEFGPLIVVYPGLLIAAFVALFSARRARSFLSKVILSGLCGMLFAVFLVIFPAFMNLNPNPKLQLDPALQADLMLQDSKEHRSGLTYANTFELRQQLLWLHLAQQIIDCMPILLAGSCIGPAILIIRRVQPSKENT